MNLPRLTVFAGEGRYQIELTAIVTSDGFSVTLTGGERSHVGAAVICLPAGGLPNKESCMELSVPGHRDIVAAKLVARAICRYTGVKTAVVCGIHIDNAAKSEIIQLLRNCMEATRKITAALIKMKKRDSDA